MTVFKLGVASVMGVLIGVSSSMAHAIEWQTFDPSPYSQSVTDCDREAAHPDDPNKVVPGRTSREMNLDTAIRVCRADLAKDPNNPRDPGSYGPKLYCLSGHVEKPGCYEAPLGITARQLIDEFGGGVWKGRAAKAVIPGGISMGLMTASELDTPLDFAGPGKVGCLGLGTAAVVVIDDQTSIVDFLHNSCRFFAHESCGQCTPCREGTSWSLRMLERIKAGKGRLKDLDLLLELGNTMGMMPGSTICGLADGAAWPIKNAINKFRGEFEDTIKRTNPEGWMVTDPVPALQIVGAH